MNKEFKVGDKVYYPEISTKVLELTKDPCDSEFNRYPLRVTVGASVYNFTTDGKHSLTAALPILSPANEETHELLEKLYGVEFEKPPRKALGNEIVQAMLARGDKYVPCWLSDGHQCPNSAQETDFVTAIADDLSYVTTVTGFEWNYATPFDPRTLEPITELPEPTRRMATLTVPHYNS